MALNDTAIILFTFENSVQIHCIHTNFIISFSKFLKSKRYKNLSKLNTLYSQAIMLPDKRIFIFKK